MTENLKTFYFDLAHAIEEHRKIIELSGGMSGYDQSKVLILESTLYHIQNDIYYPTFLDKITHLFYSINKNHAFFDGNKRSSIGLSAYFLKINNYDYCIDHFIYEMEDIAVWVAENIVDKDLLKAIIKDLIFLEKSEEVKVALIEALTKNSR